VASKRKRRISGRVAAVVLGGSMTFSGFYWNLISERLARRIARIDAGLATERASQYINAFGLLWSSIGLLIILSVFTRMYVAARRSDRH
jgi:hypothetical protein